MYMCCYGPLCHIYNYVTSITDHYSTWHPDRCRVQQHNAYVANRDCFEQLGAGVARPTRHHPRSWPRGLEAQGIRHARQKPGTCLHVGCTLHLISVRTIRAIMNIGDVFNKKGFVSRLFVILRVVFFGIISRSYSTLYTGWTPKIIENRDVCCCL